MRLDCRLVEIREALRPSRSLRSIAAETDINPGELSLIERGIRLPSDAQVPRLELAYQAVVTDWYGDSFSPIVRVAVKSDDG